MLYGTRAVRFVSFLPLELANDVLIMRILDPLLVLLLHGLCCTFSRSLLPLELADGVLILLLHGMFVRVYSYNTVSLVVAP